MCERFLLEEILELRWNWLHVLSLEGESEVCDGCRGFGRIPRRPLEVPVRFAQIRKRAETRTGEGAAEYKWELNTLYCTYNIYKSIPSFTTG
ncbi:hypothetical protein GCM10028857_22960 [Salinarchaeum chitinilyticum]